MIYMSMPVPPLNLDQFLNQYSVIAQAAANLRENTRDSFAVGLLISFEDFDKAWTADLTNSKKRVLRDSLRAVVAELLKHHAGAPVDALLDELDVVVALTSQGSRSPKPRRYVGRKSLALLVAACIGAAGSAAIFLPQTSTAQADTVAAEQEIANLKVRLAQVANEKAQEQDAKEYANVAAQELVEVALIAADITTGLELCIEYGNEAVEIALKIGDGYTYNQQLLEKFTDDWDEACDEALDNASALREYLAELQAP